MLYPGNKIFAQRINIGKKHQLYSGILKENRSYWVYLPESYEQGVFTQKAYPVMILLDGDAHFHSATGIVQALGINRKIPEMIVVGVLNTDRTRDLTPLHSEIGPYGKKVEFYKSSGGGDTFLRFLEEELLPHIDSSYRTMPFRVFAGHSFGGLLALNSFLKNENTFNAYIAMDPSAWFGERYLEKKLKALPDSNFKSRLYISVANNSSSTLDTTEVRQAVNSFYSSLKSKFPGDKKFRIQYFEEEDHASVPLLSLVNGLNFIFQGYHFLNVHYRDIPEIEEHYKQFSLNHGIKFSIPEELINSIGYYNLYYARDYDKALKYFLYNTKLYPKSSNVFDSLGECYQITENKKKAIECYRKALELNPSNVHCQQKLNELEGK
jgi:predicted alpha/beta superfamily hydrolase